MYEEFYGLNRRPFENTPNPEFFFASKQHREGLAALVYGIKQSKGFMLVTGEVGSGKTFLIQSLKYELEEENHIILEVATPWITPEELFAELPAKLGMNMDAEWGSLVFQSKLKEHLERLHEEGRRVLVILDEAQQLPERTLEGIRLLSNFETEDAKLIQIVFLGQNELNEIIGRYSMRQIRQRITLSRSLGYFNETEARRYIEHRLKVAGRSEPLFSEDSLSLIFHKSHGSPRLINLICDNCLITGYAHLTKKIDADIVREVVSDLPLVGVDDDSDNRDISSVVDDESPVTPQADNDQEVSTSDLAAPAASIRSRGTAGRYGLWLVLILTVVVSWFSARWYESKDRQQQTLVADEQVAAPQPVVNVPDALVKEARELLSQQPVNKTSDSRFSVEGVVEPQVKAESAENGIQSINPVLQRSEGKVVEVYPEALSLFERLRLEANVADVQTDAFPKASQAGPEKLVKAGRVSTQANLSSIPVTDQSGLLYSAQSTPLIAQAETPKGAAGFLEVSVLEGIVTSSKKPKQYESGLNIAYPFVRALPEFKQSVRLSDGETLSERARKKYTTWNDSVQDMVRALNPALGNNMDHITTSRRINMPDIKKHHLVVNQKDFGWFAFVGTLTSRLKANNLYEFFVEVGEPVDMVVEHINKRKIYRVYIGPYVSEQQVLHRLSSISLLHMPFVE